jgi:hypothetical protein
VAAGGSDRLKGETQDPDYAIPPTPHRRRDLYRDRLFFL